MELKPEYYLIGMFMPRSRNRPSRLPRHPSTERQVPDTGHLQIAQRTALRVWATGPRIKEVGTRAATAKAFCIFVQLQVGHRPLTILPILIRIRLRRGGHRSARLPIP